MENQTLSIQQMRHLKELGVDTSKASILRIPFLDGEIPVKYTDNLYQEDGDGKTEGKFILEQDGVKRYVDFSYIQFKVFDSTLEGYEQYKDSCGAFTLQDILDLLPKYIEYKLDIYLFSLSFEDGMWWSSYNKGDGIALQDYWATNALEAAYQMLCWCADNGYLKGGEK